MGFFVVGSPINSSAPDAAGIDDVQWLPIAGIDRLVGQSGEPHTNSDPFDTTSLPTRTDAGGRRYLLVRTGPGQAMEYDDAAGWYVAGVEVSEDAHGTPSVVIRLDEAGAERLRDLTSRHIGQPLAIVVDGYVRNAPLLQSALGANIMIAGELTDKEARAVRDKLARTLMRHR